MDGVAVQGDGNVDAGVKFGDQTLHILHVCVGMFYTRRTH